MNLCITYFIVLSSAVLVSCFDNNIPSPVKGIPDKRPPGKIESHTSRGSGTGPIPPGYRIVVVMAFAAFVILMVVIILYKRDKGIRGQEKSFFLNVY